MSARLLILDAGSGASRNLIHSLRAADPRYVIVGCSDCPFFLQKSEVDRRYVLPEFSRDFAAAVSRIVEEERIDVVIPTSDLDVARLAALRGVLGTAVFLPSDVALDRCRDKLELALMLRERGIPAPRTEGIRDVDEVDEVFARFPPGERLWCRIRAGSGSYGAIPVATPAQVRSWIEYWRDMRFVEADSFTLSEYLPGRDYCVQCLWDRGTLVLAKMAERITYLASGSPSGVSSMPALAKTAFDRGVIETCASAIRAVDAHASGVFFVDLKENAEGVACVTEINAGRFATMTNIHDLAGVHNMAHVYVKLARGERVDIPNASDYPGEYYLVRAVDTVPFLLSAADLFKGLKPTLH